MERKERKPVGAMAKLADKGRRFQAERERASNEVTPIQRDQHGKLATSTPEERPANDQQTVTERSPISNQTVTEASPNGNQTVTERSPVELGTVTAPNKRSPKGASNGNRTVTERSPNDNQTVTTHASKRHTYSSLVGLQKSLIDFYYESITAHGGECTHEIRAKELQTLMGCSLRGIINANHKLTKAGLIRRADYKDGRAGWTKFSIEKSVKEDMHKQLMIRERSPNGNRTVTKPSPERSPQSSCSSSSLSLPSEGVLITPSITTTTADLEISAIKASDEKINQMLALLKLSKEARRELGDNVLQEQIRLGRSLVWLQKALDIFTACLRDDRMRVSMKNPAGLFVSQCMKPAFLNPPPGYWEEEALKDVEQEQLQMLADKVEETKAKLAYKQDETPLQGLDDIPF